MPAMNVVVASWSYCPLSVVGRVSFLMLVATCSQVVARAVKHALAMVGHVGFKKKLDDYRRKAINIIVIEKTVI